MGKSKKYQYDYDDYDEGKGPATMVEEILADPEFPQVTQLIIGSWGSACEDDCQEILDGIRANKDKFAHVESLFVGDMDYEECEVSWILQGNYSDFWEAMPQLKELTIKGSMDLVLGDIVHQNLEALTIICGGLPVSVIQSIKKAKLPSLKKLVLYIGIENYGFDGNKDTIKALLEESDFPKLEYLGIEDSEIQDELVQVVLESKYMKQLHTLDLANGTLTDKGGELLLGKLPSYPNIKVLDVHYHYMSEEMEEKLKALPIEVDTSESNEPEEYRGEIWMNAMLTE
ncbi:MAG: cytoplasmic protein [Hungatella sp.]|jgi:Ran GTPase-activating protein (RanGAP) involved in mRNA processing and transport|nr:cytoplasmic protein [Hungatella sp.]MCI9637255.1 cytoplasmic protein [Hungatella sp.]